MEVKITPEKKATIEMSEEVLLLITGSNVSIAVAPAADTDSKAPIFLAIKGINIIAKTSLMTLLKKAILPKWALILESSIAEREYHPSPALTANPCPKFKGVMNDATAPPIREPIIVEMGRNHILLPKFFNFENIPELPPISMPTKNNNRQRPKSIKESELVKKNSC